MKSRSLFFAAAALLILPTVNSLAADDADTEGYLELGIRGVDEDGNSAKFEEYRDLTDGVFGNALLDYFKGSYYFGVEGKNIGQDDQFYMLKGGDYGKFKYSFFYDEIPHNLSFDDKTFFSGIGTSNLTILGIDPFNEAAWRTFDYTVDRKNYGGDVGISLKSPFFVDLGVNRQEKDGLKPLGSGGFSGQVEMPEPVDYTTDNFTIAGGYHSSDLLFKVSGLLSSFDNDKEYLQWMNPFTGVNEVNTLPPDNDYGKIAANMTWRKLPMMSSLLVNGSYSNLSNDIAISDLHVSVPEGLNQMTFDGDVSYTTISASLVSRPFQGLDTRLFYDYLDKDNDSSIIQYIGDGNATDLFGYTKNNAGLDVNYDLAAQTKLGAGYGYQNIDRRNRPDVESNTDNLLYVKLKNTSLEYLAARVEYSYLDRDADQEYETGISIYDPEYIERFVQRFDYTTKKQNLLKVALEIYPVDAVDFGLEYRYANNDYDDTTLGRTEDKGHEFYVDFMWRAAQMLNLSGFAGYEKYEADSNHYNFTAGSGSPPQAADPTINDGNPSSYRWSQFLDDDFWTFGLLGEMPLMQDRLKLSLSWQYQTSDGGTDFSTEGTTPLVPIDQSEDYDLTTVEAKIRYALTETLDLALGYMYEKMNYDDLQYIGYEYQPNGSILSGAYADHDYEAHIGYFTVRYKL